MKMSSYSEPRILAILRQAEGGVPVAQLCREHGMMPLPGSGLPANRERDGVVLQVAGEVWRHALSGFCFAKPCRVTEASMIAQTKALEV